MKFLILGLGGLILLLAVAVFFYVLGIRNSPALILFEQNIKLEELHAVDQVTADPGVLNFQHELQLSRARIDYFAVLKGRQLTFGLGGWRQFFRTITSKQQKQYSSEVRISIVSDRYFSQNLKVEE